MGWDEDETVIVENLFLITSTDKAYLVRTIEDEEVWIPKSQVLNINFGKEIFDDEKGANIKEIDSIEIPVWLAEDKGLI